jgi:hypothetical protein
MALLNQADAVYLGGERVDRIYLGSEKVWANFLPLDMFANGEKGAWRDPSDPASLFQDGSGAPAQFGGTVYAIRDDVHAVNTFQQSSSLRPVYYKDPDTQIVGLRFDHVDDRMTQNFPDGIQGDLIICGTEGSWIDENVVIPAGGDLTIGPKDLPNTPGMFSVLGDIIGWVLIDRVTTVYERRAVISYYRSKGAKGLLVEGPELVTNGDFSDGTTGWAATGADITVENNALKVIVTSSSLNQVNSNTVTMEIGKVYSIKISIKSATRARLRAVGVVGFQISQTNVWQSYEVKHRAAQSAVSLALAVASFAAYGGVGEIGYFRDVSVRKMTPEEEL